jgi:hypothetical protein
MLIFQSQIVRPRKQIRPFEYQYQLNQEQRGLALDTFWKRFQNESLSPPYNFPLIPVNALQVGARYISKYAFTHYAYVGSLGRNLGSGSEIRAKKAERFPLPTRNCV